MRSSLSLTALLLFMGSAIGGPGMTADAINMAEMPKAAKGLQPGVIKAEVLLDRLHFSPGVIDGTGGDNFRKALGAFKTFQQLEGNGQLDKATWARLTDSSAEPVAADYTLTDADVKGPFVPNIPLKMEDMAKLPNLAIGIPSNASRRNSTWMRIF